MPRTIFAFNGDLESRLALHWLVHERGHEVVALSLNLGQEVYLEPLGEMALELGAVVGAGARPAGRVPARLRPAGPPGGRRLPGRLLPRLGPGPLRHRPGAGAASPTKRAAPRSPTAPPARATTRCAWRRPSPPSTRAWRCWPRCGSWNLRTPEDKLNYARRRGIPIEEPAGRAVTIDRNLWGASIYLHDLQRPLGGAAGRRVRADARRRRPPRTSRRR